MRARLRQLPRPRYLKWEFYLARLDIRGVKRGDSLLTFLSGFVLTVTPGKVGEVFKSLVLFETHGVPVARTAPIVIAERVTDVIGIVVLIVLGKSSRLRFGRLCVWAGMGTAAVVVLLVVVSNRGLSLTVIGLVAELPVASLRRVGPKLIEAYDSLATLLKPANLFVPTFLSIGAWSLECCALWVILRGFGEHTGLGLATFFYATSTLVGARGPGPQEASG